MPIGLVMLALCCTAGWHCWLVLAALLCQWLFSYVMGTQMYAQNDEPAQ
jgi:hypothetical protein